MTVNILERLEFAESLPSLPAVAIQILELTRSEDVSVDKLAKVLQNDPALTAKILKLVNSSIYGMAREVGSIKQAMVILGLRTVKIMALSFSVVEALKSDRAGSFDLETYWKRSLYTAVLSRLLSRSILPRMTEEAFVAGLLSDIGMFVAWKCAPEGHEAVEELMVNENRSQCDAETAVYGTHHAAIGKTLLAKWSLPESVCAAIGAHHGHGLEAMSGAERKFADIIRSAAALSSVFAGISDVSTLPQLVETVASDLETTVASINEVLHSIDSHVRDAAKLLSLKIGEMVSFAQLQASATQQLALLSVQAELDRSAAANRAETAESNAKKLTAEKRAAEEQATTDALTRIANRAAFDRRLGMSLQNATTLNQPLGLIMADVDHFKSFNDTYGHQAGDEVLKFVASSLQNSAKNAGFVARYGGEEFAVIVINKSADELRALAEQIRAAVARTKISLDGKDVNVTASFGVAALASPQAGMTPDKIIRIADERLYAAKRNGRNRVEMSQ